MSWSLRRHSIERETRRTSQFRFGGRSDEVAGGDLGFISRGSTNVPGAVVDAAFALKNVGDVSEPVGVDAGWVAGASCFSPW